MMIVVWKDKRRKRHSFQENYLTNQLTLCWKEKSKKNQNNLNSIMKLKTSKINFSNIKNRLQLTEDPKVVFCKIFLEILLKTDWSLNSLKNKFHYLSTSLEKKSQQFIKNNFLLATFNGDSNNFQNKESSNKSIFK